MSAKEKMKKLNTLLFGLLTAGLVLLLSVSNSSFSRFEYDNFNDPIEVISEWDAFVDGKKLPEKLGPMVYKTDVPVTLTAELNDERIRYNSINALYYRTYYNDLDIRVGGELIYSYPDRTKPMPFGRDTPEGDHYISIYPQYYGLTLSITLYPTGGYRCVKIGAASLTTKSRAVGKIVGRDILRLSLDMILVFMGLSLTAIFLIFYRYEKNFAVLWLGLMLICYAVFDLTFSDMVLMLFKNKYLYYMLSYAVCSMAGALWMCFALHFTAIRRKNLFSCMLSVSLATALICLLLHVLSLCDYHESCWFMLIGAVGMPLISIIIMAHDHVRYKESGKWAFAGTIGLLVFISGDVGYYIITQRDGRTSLLSTGLLIFSLCFTADIARNTIEGLMRQNRLKVLEFAAYHDQLTGCLNRRAFERKMDDYRPREGTLSPKIYNLAMVMFDSNNLKITNDTFGHAKGDKLIVDTVEIINRCLGSMGELYRIGGDEFVCVCDCGDRSKLRGIMAKFDAMANIGAEPINVSWGEAFFEEAFDVDPDSILMRAENRMYEHKRRCKI